MSGPGTRGVTETDLISVGRGRRREISGDTPVSGGLLSECEHQPWKENTESVTGVWGGQDAGEIQSFIWDVLNWGCNSTQPEEKKRTQTQSSRNCDALKF